MSLIGSNILSRAELAALPTPAGTLTHRPVPHHEIVKVLVETLGFRHIGIMKDEYAISRDMNKMFGVLDLEMSGIGLSDAQERGVRFSIGIRNSHDKTMRLAMVVGYRVMVCENMAFSGDFHPVLAKHSKNFNLMDAISIGVDQMQRNFSPMIEQVDLWRGLQLSDDAAKMVIYEAFIEGVIDAPKHLARSVHDLYFTPRYPAFEPRTLWSLSNAFTSAFKEIDPVPKFRATASLPALINKHQDLLRLRA